MNKVECEICKKTFSEDQLIANGGIPRQIKALISDECPEWNDGSQICKDDFNIFRMKHIKKMVESERESIEGLEKSVIESIEKNEMVTYSTNTQSEPLKMGDRIADAVASFGGSWKFIIIFFSIMSLWIIGNSIILLTKPFDPFPFILLNLVLSCLAAVQAPIIMMSQNRQETKDRIRSENDYKINLKSEIEIRTLHEKVDHLLLDQWSKMMDIQEIQMEILEVIRKKIEE